MGRYISGSGSGSETYYNNELVMLRLGLAKNKREFKTVGSDSWTLDHNAMVRIRVWGGGGSGGNVAYRSYYDHFYLQNSGGGAGGFAEVIMNLTAGTYAIVVGAGGAGVTSGAVSGTLGENLGGKAGGTSSFSTYISATGGKGGGITLWENGTGDGDSLVQSGTGGEGIISPGTSVLYSKVLRGGNGGRAAFSSPGGPDTGASGLGYSAGSSGGGVHGGGGGGGYGPETCYGTIAGGGDTPSDNGSAPGGSGIGYGAGGGGTVGGKSISGVQGIVVIEWN